MPRCDVCTEMFTECQRRKVTCPYCEFSGCRQCHQRYLLTTTEYAHCMSCRKGWDREVLTDQFTQAFVNGPYKLHRENVLYDRERSLMPETQPYVEIEVKCRQIDKRRLELENELKDMREPMNTISWCPASMFGKESTVENNLERERQLLEYHKKNSSIGHEIAHGHRCTSILRDHGPVQRRQFVRACPVNNCKGFLSTAWKCGLCMARVCSECHEVKDPDAGADDHMCDPDSLATAKMLAKDSRPCPKCASMIFKISGCDQMYCTQCHTPFSWRTGAVETGVVHNPHYYDYMRRNGGVARQPGDVQCGGLPNPQHFYSQIKNANSPYSQQQVTYLWAMHQNIGHVQAVDMYRPLQVQDTRDIRIKYMLNDISEEDFKRKLQQREKAYNKNREIREVLQMYTTVATDIMQRMVQSPRTNLFQEFVELIEYATSLLTKISTRWKCRTPVFHEMRLLV
jgi:hypothetical protein